jgi:GT2 family glycosyltransferase
MKIGIGFCNYNRCSDLCRAVDCVITQGVRPTAIVVVDNASQDDSVDRLRKQFGSQIEIEVLSSNQGSAGGFKRASETLFQKNCELIFLLDSDCFLAPGALAQMMHTLDTNPQVSVLGARIMHEHQPDTIQECGAFLDWEIGEFRLNRRDKVWEGEGSLPDFEEVDYVPACALIARREVFEQVGFFDPGWFIYFDDIEWCWRAKLAGFQIRVNNRVAAFHKGGGKVKTSHFSTYYYWRNRMRFFGIYTGEQSYSQMKENLIETTCRAIATCEVLGLERTAHVISRAMRDGIGRTVGQALFADGELDLDSGGEYHLSVQSRIGTCFSVEHLFDPLPEESASCCSGYVLDRFGKCISLENHRRLQPRFIEKFSSLRLELGPRMDEYLGSLRSES